MQIKLYLRLPDEVYCTMAVVLALGIGSKCSEPKLTRTAVRRT